MTFEVIEDHTLHTRFLNSESVVLDLGANCGSFSKAMIERFQCRCIAVEPSPRMFEQIEPHPRLEKYHLAIAPESKPFDFHISDIPVASSLAHKPASLVETITIEAKRLDDLISDLGLARVDLIKMDIEGIEIDVLRSCSDKLLKSVGQITIEFHDHIGSVSRADIESQIARFKSLGFIHFSKYLGCYYDTLFLNQALCPISTLESLWFRHAVRNWKGIERRLQRWQGAAI